MHGQTTTNINTSGYREGEVGAGGARWAVRGEVKVGGVR